MESQGDGLSFNHGGLGYGSAADKGQYPSSQGSLDFQDSIEQQLLNSQNQHYGSLEGRHNVPNIILTGETWELVVVPNMLEVVKFAPFLSYVINYTFRNTSGLA